VEDTYNLNLYLS